jgi:hypothetical protein
MNPHGDFNVQQAPGAFGQPQPPDEGQPPQWANPLLEMIRQMQEQQNDQATLITSLRTRMETQDRLLAQAYPPRTGSPGPTIAPTPALAPISQHHENRPTKFLGDLPAYNGTRNDFRPWLQQAHAKLSVDYSQQSPTVRFWFLHGRLGESPRGQVSPWIAANTGGTIDDSHLQGLIRQLEIAYDDPERQKRALRKLQTMEQGSKRFVQHLAKFNQRMIEAGGSQWEDSLKIAWLDKTLSNEISRYLVAVQIPDSYEAFTSMLHQIAQRAEALRNSTRPNPTNFNQRRTNNREGGSMEWEPSRTVQVASASSQNKRRARWVSNEIIQSRRNKNQCFRCGSDDHRSQGCDLLPAERPVRVLAAQETKVEEPSDDEGSLSGKD